MRFQFLVRWTKLSAHNNDRVFCQSKKILNNYFLFHSISKYWLIDDKGNYYDDPDSTLRIKCDYIISAFGSNLNEELLKSARYSLFYSVFSSFFLRYVLLWLFEINST
jgi:hypothetical protein